jgi:glycosyltransferase involved in cell wall biosynthesis
MITVLHLVKTSDGAGWAAQQARVLCSLGVSVHVVLPDSRGRALDLWRSSGAKLHFLDIDLRLGSLGKVPFRLSQFRRLVQALKPDVVHSHFVSTTLFARLALGHRSAIPRLFQVAGPLHLEHWGSRSMELRSAGPQDHWIASSRCIAGWYERLGVSRNRIHLSYWGMNTVVSAAPAEPFLRRFIGVEEDTILVGNVSWMYPPKWYLWQSIGLKCHEDVIVALAKVVRRDSRVVGVLVGGAWGGAHWYEERLRRLAYSLAGDRIRFTGPISGDLARRAWSEIDLAVHVPLSENCGGVIEPLCSGVPTIASAVGGIPEVVMHGRTGYLVPPRDPNALALAVSSVLCNMEEARLVARVGGRLVQRMFDVERTAREIPAIYDYVLGRLDTTPVWFDSAAECGKY